ncbi:5-(carboxyamino)imidazole ribonucleotide synthase [Leptolyngbya sp. 7M]|uniref:5-(carboxyamino)imidazole ribonucleotide synthase n=1 Tax=Leptolyngbya sp. 7M TaxID=2812896 RepID=UPI001B8BA393|nr:5-(carboxyamino)imidazole ribonucleotide synthase [Leptolyngbya sp. 7M]QYO68537.1 5-(carboxyamino)imidazole ribonucleotide synthase [Leptolyngbya sp. 7M]
MTFEFENVPAATIEAAAQFVEVHPKCSVLHTTQNRLREKTFLSNNGFPVTPFRHISSLDDLYPATTEFGFPCVLKTAGFGYDGKGQSKIDQPNDIESAFAAMSGSQAILEAFVDFQKEVSVVCARGADGEFVHYGVIENVHRNHILDLSFAPGSVSAAVRDDAAEITRNIAETFGYVGTMCVEFFLTQDDRLLVNEIAPRPHNSGHLTFGPCVTSQFEQQVRAVCGLPLGSTEFYKPAAMANLLGDLWESGEPNWIAALSKPNVQLHIYGKSAPRNGRKMGHITATADSAKEASKLVRSARNSLTQTG